MSEATELIKERLNLADVIGEYVPLKRLGGHWKGLCPFHQEKTPSFVVSPDKGIWHCFGCGEGGDIFSFVQRVEGLDFRGSLKLLAERAGVELPERSAPAVGDTRGRLFELLALAAKFYHEILMHQSAGSKAKEYLHQRGVTDKTMEEFLIGYAPPQWDVVQTFLKRKGFTVAEMIEAGLAGKNDSGQHFDRFRARIMFPVHDVQGRVVAFGGRIVPWHATGREGKYVNSPETSIYQKRRTIYNLNRAKQAIRTQGVGVVVEGYMDIVMLVQAGIANVVASSGTAFTPEQIEQLKRFTSTLHFAFDTDRAGIHAAIAATRAAVAAGMRVATVAFPSGKDPADVVLEEPTEVATYVTTPRSLVAVLLEQLGQSETASSREELLQEIVPLIKQTTNVVQQGEMVQELSQLLHVPESVLLERLAQQPIESIANVSEPGEATATALTAEQRLLGLLIAEPGSRAVAGGLTAELLTAPATQSLFEQLQQALGAVDPARASGQEVIRQLPDSFVPLAEALRAETEASRTAQSPPAEKEARALLRFLRLRHLDQRLKILQAQLAGGSQAPLDEALRQFQAVAEELESVKAEG